MILGFLSFISDIIEIVIWFFIIVIAVVIIYGVIILIQNIKNRKNTSNSYPKSQQSQAIQKPVAKESPKFTYKLKSHYMTTTEKMFYNNFCEILKNTDYIVIPQVNLATIIDKVSNNNDIWRSELFHNIDFCIFNKDTFLPVLLIEINDNRHYSDWKVRKRDEKVENICKEVNLPFIKFWPQLYDFDANYNKKRLYDLLHLSSQNK